MNIRNTKTLEGFRRRIWGVLNQRTVNGSHPGWSNPRMKQTYLDRGVLLLMSKEEFWNWCEKNKNRIELLIRKKKTPSIDRIKSDQHYSIDNIRIMDLDLNRLAGLKKACEGRKKPVIGTDLSSGKITRYSSASDAIKDGFDFKKISMVCLGKAKSHRGYGWKFGN